MLKRSNQIYYHVVHVLLYLIIFSPLTQSDKKQTPILVFDLAQLIQLMCKEEKDTFFGGRWKIYAGRKKNF